MDFSIVGRQVGWLRHQQMERLVSEHGRRISDTRSALGHLKYYEIIALNIHIREFFCERFDTFLQGQIGVLLQEGDNRGS